MDFGHFPSHREQQNIIDTGLSSAAAIGDVEQLELYLATGDVSERALNTALLEALKSGHPNSEVIVSLLVQNGAILNSYARLDEFIAAAGAGDVETVKLYLLAGAGEKACNVALINAVNSEHHNSVEIICSLKNKDAYLGDNAIEQFFAAIKEGNYDKVFNFVTAGIEGTQVTNRQGQTALMVAAQYGHTDIIEYLCHEGSDINAVTQNRHQDTYNTAMDFAAEYAMSEGSFTALSFFINNKAVMNPQLPIGRYNEKADVPLIVWAAYYGLKDIIPSLLSNYGAELDEVELIKGQTALAWAVSRGHISTAIALIGLGANPDVKNAEGVSLIDLAISQNKVEFVRYLLENKYVIADEILLQTAIKSGNVSIVAAVLDAIPDVLQNDKVKASSPVYQAVSCGHAAIVSLLLRRGFAFDQINDANHKNPGETPLLEAILGNRIKALDVLLRAYGHRAWLNKVEIDADIERHLHLPTFAGTLLNANQAVAFRFLSSLPSKRVNQLGDLRTYYDYTTLILRYKAEMKEIRTKMLTLFGVHEVKAKPPVIVPLLPLKQSFMQKIIDNFWYVVAVVKQAFGLTKPAPVVVVPVSVEIEPEPAIVEPMPQLPNELISEVLGQPTLEISKPLQKMYPFWYQHRAKKDLDFVLNSIAKVKSERKPLETADIESLLAKKPEQVVFALLNKFGENGLEKNQLPNTEKLDNVENTTIIVEGSKPKV